MTDAIVRALRELLDNERGLANLLERSLVDARDRAGAELRPELFAELEWPQDTADYESYLSRLIRWVPHQSDAKAWQAMKPEQRQAKEVSDRTAHFFFLVNQEVDGESPQGNEAFRGWMTAFTGRWGDFLDTAESFGPDVLQSFIGNAPEYRVHDSLINGVSNMPSGWLTFNQFIARELNGGLRPIAEPGDNTVVTSPADCLYQQAYGIDAESNIPATTIKNTHKYGNIGRLLEGSAFADVFAGGTFVHYELPPSAYHRYHLPVAGRVKEAFHLSGQVFMQVGLQDSEFKSSDSATSGFEFSQNRGVVTVDTSASDAGDIGVVAVVPVGMAHVSSVRVTAEADRLMAKGEEFGYFQFGGSDIIVLFQAGTEPQIDTDEHYRLVGTPIARCKPRS